MIFGLKHEHQSSNTKTSQSVALLPLHLLSYFQLKSTKTHLNFRLHGGSQDSQVSIGAGTVGQAIHQKAMHQAGTAPKGQESQVF